MADAARILTQRHVAAMVALDTAELLAERVRNLLAHDRRITTARRYATYTQQPPEVAAGLTLDEVRTWNRNGAGIAVRLNPGLMAGFGFAAYEHENDTEAGEWKRYHAAENASDDFFKRRRDMTRIDINGGLSGDGPARDDQITIRHWNKDGVCDEVVVAFDYGPDREEIRDRVAQHLWATDGGNAGDWERIRWAVADLAGNGSGLRLAEAPLVEKCLARADAILAVITGKEG